MKQNVVKNLYSEMNGFPPRFYYQKTKKKFLVKTHFDVPYTAKENK